MWLFESLEGRLAVALGIGLLIGAERERRKGRGPARKVAGVRTFALVALVGGVAGALGDAVTVAAGALAIGSFATASYVVGDRTDPGLTSEAALVLAYALGALAQTEPRAALACGVSAAMLLALRVPLHRLTRLLTEDELRDALVFAVAAAQHGVRSCLEYAKTFDLERARALSNPALSPHLEFVDMGGHGYATVRLSGDEMRTEFVCIPRPIARSERSDGGPLRYRVAHSRRLQRAARRGHEPAACVRALPLRRRHGDRQDRSGRHPQSSFWLRLTMLAKPSAMAPAAAADTPSVSCS